MPTQTWLELHVVSVHAGGKQAPLRQMLPLKQLTPAHATSRQAPLRQTEPGAHTTCPQSRVWHLPSVHVSFAAPTYTAREDVPTEVVDAERQIYLNSDEVASKPEQAREKIVDGMLAKRFFAAAPGGVLLEQAWIHDASLSVGKALEEAGASVTAFARVSVAGS